MFQFTGQGTEHRFRAASLGHVDSAKLGFKILFGSRRQSMRQLIVSLSKAMRHPVSLRSDSLIDSTIPVWGQLLYDP